MAQITTLSKLVNGKLGTSTTINNNFDTIKTIYNAHDTATTGVHDLGTDTIANDVTFQIMVDGLMPIGSVIDVWRPTAIASLLASVDTDIWQIGDGSTISDAASDFDGMTIPDLSNRYLIGAGAEGSTLIGSAAVDATPSGNASHQIDIAHSHTSSAHTHSMTHTHVIPSHRHSVTGYIHFYAQEIAGMFCYLNLTTGIQLSLGAIIYGGLSYNSSGSSQENVPDVLGYSNYISDFLSTPTSPVCGGQNTALSSTMLSATQSHQPKSLQVKRYIRYK